jgi:hypothetical protein
MVRFIVQSSIHLSAAYAGEFKQAINNFLVRLQVIFSLIQREYEFLFLLPLFLYRLEDIFNAVYFKDRKAMLEVHEKVEERLKKSSEDVKEEVVDKKITLFTTPSSTFNRKQKNQSFKTFIQNNSTVKSGFLFLFFI